jgi:hypothetical protein
MPSALSASASLKSTLPERCAPPSVAYRDGLVLGNRFDNVSLPLKEVSEMRTRQVSCSRRRRRRLPHRPEPYIADGADLVAYSGGKILRGPKPPDCCSSCEDPFAPRTPTARRTTPSAA